MESSSIPVSPHKSELPICFTSMYYILSAFLLKVVKVIAQGNIIYVLHDIDRMYRTAKIFGQCPSKNLLRRIGME